MALDGRMIRETSGMNKRVFSGCHPRKNTSDHHHHHHHIHRQFTTVSVVLGRRTMREDEALAQTEREILLNIGCGGPSYFYLNMKTLLTILGLEVVCSWSC
jgi:hypothetical protein